MSNSPNDKPIEEIKLELESIYDENNELITQINEMKHSILQKKKAAAAILVERNWYLQVIDRLDEASKMDERLRPIADALQ